jgi:GNAT superfamily N-acetyltransferase
MSLYLRPVLPEDDRFVYELLYDNFYETLMAHFWDPKIRDPLIKLQIDGQRSQYRAEFPNADHGIIMYDDRPIGRILMDRRTEWHYLVDILIQRQYRKKGIGTWLLRALCIEAEMMQKPMRLTVRTTNPAKELYKRLGFHIIEDYTMVWLMERPVGATVLVNP